MIRKEIQLLIDRLNQNHPDPNIENALRECKEDTQKQTLFSAIKQHNINNYLPPVTSNLGTRP